MSSNDDLYKILGVPSDASDDDIKKAYRKLAKEHHPDKNPGDKESEDLFKKISAAYDVIGDPQKRKRYDEERRFGNHRFSQNGNPFHDFRSGRRFDPFADMASRFNNGSQDYVKNIEISLSLDVYAVASGKQTEMDFPIEECCEECDGRGHAKDSKESTCVRCSGTGEFRAVNANIIFSVRCPECLGSGKIFERCVKCNGAGVIPKPKKISVKIPGGIRNGMVFSIRGAGHFSPGTKKRGDIDIGVEILEHNFFKLANEDVHVQVPVKFIDLIIGTKINVPTLYGIAEVNIPSGSQNGSVFRLSGVGVPASPNSSRKGDMFVHVIADMPKGFSSEFEEKIRELDDSSAQYEMGKLYSDVLKDIEKERESMG